MSNRSVFEFNHDFSSEIAKNEERFVSLLLNYIRCACADNARPLERYGLTWYGSRHHSDPWENHIRPMK